MLFLDPLDFITGDEISFLRLFPSSCVYGDLIKIFFLLLLLLSFDLNIHALIEVEERERELEGLIGSG